MRVDCLKGNGYKGGVNMEASRNGQHFKVECQIDEKITLMAYEDAEAKKQQAKPQKVSSS